MLKGGVSGEKKSNRIILSLILLGSLFYLSAYSEKNADIFQWDGRVYKAGIDWVDKLKLSKKDLLGEISSNSQKTFKDGIANKLPVGAKIYSAKERNDILIIEFDGKTKYYLVQAEG